MSLRLHQKLGLIVVAVALGGCQGGDSETDCPAIAIPIVTGTITSPSGEYLNPDRIELIDTDIDGLAERNECRILDPGDILWRPRRFPRDFQWRSGYTWSHMKHWLATVAVIVCSGVACTGGGASDAGSAQADACTLVYIPAVAGDVVDAEGGPLVPDAVEYFAIDTWSACRVEEVDGAVPYNCSGGTISRPIAEVPSIILPLRAALDGQSWQWEIDVARASNCHFVTTEFDLVLPPTL